MEAMNRRRKGGGRGGSKGLSWKWLMKFLSVSMRVLQLLYQCLCFIQCLCSCAGTDGIPHLAERTAAEYTPGEAGYPAFINGK